MKKIIPILTIILVIVFLILAYWFFSIADDIKQTDIEKKEINKKIEVKNEKIEELNNQLENTDSETIVPNDKTKSTIGIVRAFIENYYVIKRDKVQLKERTENLKGIMSKSLFDELMISKVNIASVQSEHEVEQIEIFLNEEGTEGFATFNQYRISKDGNHSKPEKTYIQYSIDQSENKAVFTDIDTELDLRH